MGKDYSDELDDPGDARRGFLSIRLLSIGVASETSCGCRALIDYFTGNFNARVNVN